MAKDNLSLMEKAFDVHYNFVIALDGAAGVGKGTIGRILAQKFHLIYFQSSLLYRNLAFLCYRDLGYHEHGILDEESIINLSSSPDILNYPTDQELTSEHIADLASRVATIPKVRANLSEHLVKIIATTPRIIMEGRDIATVIAPSADLKIFLTANVAARAERRYKQLRAEGKNCILGEILNQLKARDLRDTKRTVAPLIAASDALIINTSTLTPGQIIDKIEKFIRYL